MERGVPAALAGEDNPVEWLGVLQGTLSAWEAAYTGAPASRAERAAGAIGSDPERVVPVALEAGQRVCAQCGEGIPDSRATNARYCSHTCQRAANGRARDLPMLAGRV